MTPSIVPTSNNSNRSFNGSTSSSSIFFQPTSGTKRDNIPPYLRGIVSQSSPTLGKNNSPSRAQGLATSVATDKNTSTNATAKPDSIGGILTEPGRAPANPPAYIGKAIIIPTSPSDTPLNPIPDRIDPPLGAVPPLPPGNPFEYDWNLPPHKWSLPTLHTVVNEAHYTNNKIPAPKVQNDSYRRGRLWWKASADINVVQSNGKKGVTTTRNASGGNTRKYGFQFLWNPETFGTSVSVQLDATPTVQDRFLGVSGAFPGTQTISFNIRIDRTNDFACAATLLNRLNVDIIRRRTAAPSAFSPDAVSQFEKFYTSNNSFQVQPGSVKRGNIGVKLQDLLQRGTIADIEYLYRAINGSGPGIGESGESVEWMNGRGIKTADIGWLMPTLLHVDIGPLSYDGYVTALQVNHLAFTPDMIPIRTDLQISLNILATAALTSSLNGGY